VLGVDRLGLSRPSVKDLGTGSARYLPRRRDELLRPGSLSASLAKYMMVAAFTTAHDVTVAELKLETFLPATHRPGSG
jgi:hypothetical protein